MARIWSEESKLETWLRVELAALDAWAEVGVVPEADVHAIRQRVVAPTPERIAVNVGSACTNTLRPRLNRTLFDKTGGGGSMEHVRCWSDPRPTSVRGFWPLGSSAASTRRLAR